MNSSNPKIWRDKIALLFNTIPLKLKELDELNKNKEDTVEIEAEIFGLMMACDRFCFARETNYIPKSLLLRLSLSFSVIRAWPILASLNDFKRSKVPISAYASSWLTSTTVSMR